MFKSAIYSTQCQKFYNKQNYPSINIQAQKQMGKNKNQKITNTVKNQPKRKKIQKKRKNKLQIQKVILKKLTNQKQAVAQFPLLKLQDGKQVSSIPVFRNDKLSYTPGFSLRDQFTQSFVKQQELLQSYRLSLQQSSINLQDIKKPRPSSRNSYCTICKIRFEDYVQHIKQKTHTNQMRLSIYNQFIDEMCQKKKIERFLTNSKNITQIILVVKGQNQQSTNIFIEDYAQKDKLFFGLNKKQKLYQLVKSQVKQLNNNNQNLFDVLDILDNIV